MFRLFVKIMAVILLLALAGPFLIKGPNGKPLIGLDDLRHNIADRWDKLSTRLGPDPDPLPVYRWQDANGTLHYSDTANPDGTSVVIFIDPNSNVVPADNLSGIPHVPDVIAPPGSVLELLDDAHETTQSLEDRNEEVKQRIEEQR